ncbi:HIT domain-containing protein [Arthrobacter roseus]|uniref:HIT domain-containing protein n=1 Tax=Arthrobacter roseus TaxID=136274 RepID=UPI0019657DD4|nr:diadenosine tetraphosphate (Ap4A) HIT family hydrolase [Arthrobacter roseus]
MSTLFTQIINGEIPGRFVWKDDDVVAFLTIAPLAPGHTLVVPRDEISAWTDAGPGVMEHLMEVAKAIGNVQVGSFGVKRAGLVIAGFEVDHLHLHVFPANSMVDFDFTRVDQNPDPQSMDEAAETLRKGLREAGHEQSVPE